MEKLYHERPLANKKEKNESTSQVENFLEKEMETLQKKYIKFTDKINNEYNSIDPEAPRAPKFTLKKSEEKILRIYAQQNNLLPNPEVASKNDLLHILSIFRKKEHTTATQENKAHIELTPIQTRNISLEQNTSPTPVSFDMMYEIIETQQQEEIIDCIEEIHQELTQLAQECSQIDTVPEAFEENMSIEPSEIRIENLQFSRTQISEMINKITYRPLKKYIIQLLKKEDPKNRQTMAKLQAMLGYTDRLDINLGIGDKTFFRFKEWSNPEFMDHMIPQENTPENERWNKTMKFLTGTLYDPIPKEYRKNIVESFLTTHVELPKVTTLRKESSSYKSLEKYMDPGFAEKVESISKELDIDPNWLLATMAFETAGTLNPKQPNITEGRLYGWGLLQFTPPTTLHVQSRINQIPNVKLQAKDVTFANLPNISQVDFLDLVKAFYRPVKGQMKSRKDVYSYCASETLASTNAKLYYKGTPRYDLNQARDINTDGVITSNELPHAVLLRPEIAGDLLYQEKNLSSK